MSVPRHVAIILDGNGRWAKAKGLPRTAGHTAGAKNVEVVCEEAYNMGIEYLTLYAFSTENWNRSKEEVTALMNLLNQYLKNCLKTAKKNNMRIRVIGDISRLDPSMQEKICLLEKESASYTGLNLTIAINYGSRDEIVRGIKRMYQDVEEHKLDADAISEDTVRYRGPAGPGSDDPHQWRAALIQLLIVAVSVCRILFYSGRMAGFPRRGIKKSCGSI